MHRARPAKLLAGRRKAWEGAPPPSTPGEGMTLQPIKLIGANTPTLVCGFHEQRHRETRPQRARHDSPHRRGACEHRHGGRAGGPEVGSYCRQVLLGAPAPRQVRRPPVERRELARLLGDVGKIGGLLNQLAKASNQGLTVYQNEVLTALRGLTMVREAILKALGREP
jgi:hypothetical protein